MAEHNKADRNKQKDAKQNRRRRQTGIQPSSDQTHTRDAGPFSLSATPFHPRMDEHAVTLSGISSSAQRHEFIMRLNNTYGYRYVQRLVASVNAQAKLSVSDPGDIYEQEADRVAEEVTKSMNTPVQRQEGLEEEELLQGKLVQRQVLEEEEELIQGTFDVQRQTPEEEEELIQGTFYAQRQDEEEELQTKPDEGTTATVASDIETRINSARGGGQPLSDEVQNPMEQAFGADFSGVRTHTDPEADTLNQDLSAKAFTTGQDVFFRGGEYSPGSDNGRKLLAHELTHVLQQTTPKAKHRQKYHHTPTETNRLTRRPKIFVQRLMTEQTFKRITNAGALAVRDSMVKEIDEWIAEYHNNFDPPRNEAERDMMLNILKEIEEASSEWLKKDHSTTDEKRIPGIESIGEQARRDIERLSRMDFSKDKVVELTESERASIEKLTKKMSGDVKSSLTILAPLIDVAVPDFGDRSALKIILEVPLQPPGFIGFDLEFKAERSEDGVKVRLEFLCTVGAKGPGYLIGAKLKGKLGGYIEAQAKNSNQVMNLISYGMYRRFRESPIVPRELANAMWGGSTSRKGWKLAERWAAAIEKGIFSDASDEEEKAYVETGGVAALEAAFKAGGPILEPTGVEGEARFTSGRKYTKKSIEALKLGGKSLGEATPEELIAQPPSKRGAQKIYGEGVKTFSVTGTCEIPVANFTVSFTQTWSTEGRKPAGKGFFKRHFLSYEKGPWTLEISGSVKLPLNKLNAEGALHALLFKNLLELKPMLETLDKQMEREEEILPDKTRVANRGVDLITYLTAIADNSKDWEFDFKFPEPSNTTKGITRIEAELGIQIEKDKPIKVSLSTVNVVGIDAPVVQATLTKKKQLLSKEIPFSVK